MPHSFPRTVSCLALMLGASVLPAQVTPSRVTSGTPGKAQQPAQVSVALQHLLSQRARLGLGEADAFTCDRVATTNQGNTIVRLEHTYQGHRVWGSRAMAKVSPQGVAALSIQGLVTGVSVTGVPALTSAQAIQIAVDKLGAQEQVQGTPTVEQVVFAPRLRQESAGPIHRTAQPKAYVWAYQVHVEGRGALGPKSMNYVIDGDTGQIYRADDQFVHAAPPAATPSLGTGLGFYAGQVPLNTTRMDDGTYALWDPNRGTLDNPSLAQAIGTGSGVWTPKGLQVWYDLKDGSGTETWLQYLYQKAAPDFTDAWGDGLTWGGDWSQEGLKNGQAVGVDAMHAMGATWDFYGNIFNRNGIDGHGTSVYALTLQGGPDPNSSFLSDQAYWSNYGNFVSLGAGSYPTNPTGYLSMSDLDIVAHEMAHGVDYNTAQLQTGAGGVSEEPALAEGSADFLAQMAKAYARLGPADDPYSIPNTGIDWTMGAGVNRGTPIRWLIKPSKDTLSADSWYHGLDYKDPHYTGGVLSRALYFLAQGSSANRVEDSYSAFLPGGMTGVGNDHAARIWYKVLTENFVGHADGTLTFQDARSASLGAAIDLFGEGSPEAIGVENAFAAVNVGNPHSGPPRTEVRFSNWRNGDWTETYIASFYADRQIFPAGETVPLKITVLNNADTRVTWSIGGPSMFAGYRDTGSAIEGGRINADGTWTIPNLPGKYALTATSVADPTQFAEGRAVAFYMDCDADGENDAMDLGGIAFNWGLGDASLNELQCFSSLNGMGSGAWDFDVATIVDCIKNAWPAK